MGVKHVVLLLCVSCLPRISGNDGSEVVDLNIANPGDEFRVVQSQNYDKITVNPAASPPARAIGRVLDGANVLIEAPEAKNATRYVKLLKVPETGDFNPELDAAALGESAQPSQAVTGNHETVLEVHTTVSKAQIIDRFRKDADGIYRRCEYELVDVDICEDLQDTVEINGLKYLKLANFKTVGAVKCKGSLLVDRLNVFYRTVGTDGSKVVVRTVPRSGVTRLVTYVRHESKEHVLAERTTRKQISLDLTKEYKNYLQLAASCGNDCLFYDGCNEKNTIVDVVAGTATVYRNPKTFCLMAKVQEVRGDTYLTVFDRQRNTDTFLVKVLKKEQGGTDYSDHAKNTIDMDVADFANPKPADELSYRHLVESSTAGGTTRTRVNDIAYRIGKVVAGNATLLDEGQNVLNRELHSNAEGVVVLDYNLDGTFRRHLVKLVGNPQDETAPKTPKLASEDAIKVDLHRVTGHVTKFMTPSNNHLFIRATSLTEKVGTLTFNDNMVYPNKFFVTSQYLIMGDSDMKLHATTNRGLSFYESFAKIHSLREDDTLFVPRAKTPEHLDVTAFYEAVTSRALSAFARFDINNLGDYYLVGVSYRNLYTALVGNVSAGDRVFAPLDTDLTSRVVVLPKHSQSFVILRDCDFSDCWFKLYRQTSAAGRVGFELQPKEPRELDLANVFENDAGASAAFHFDSFTVHRHGAYNVRVTDELRHRIGRVTHRGKALVEDDPAVFTRMVNLTLGRESGTLRVLDVARWDKATRAYTYRLNGDELELTPKAKAEFVLDLEPVARKNPALNIAERHGVLSYSLAWTNRDDHALRKITCSEYEATSSNLVTSTVKEGLDDLPVFVRLYKDAGEGVLKADEVAVVVENRCELAAPNNSEFFRVAKNPSRSGLALKYDTAKRTAEALTRPARDTFFRRNYTAHRHEFAA